MVRKITITLAALLLLAGTASVVWSGLDLVPIRYLWRYGPTPGSEPTGEVIRVGDIEFVVIGRGCFRMGSNAMGKPGNVVGRFGRPIGVEMGEPVEPSDEMPVHWCEFPGGFGIAKTEVTNSQYERFDREHERGRRSEGDADPVVDVSWEDAQRYCEWLSAESHREIRLPSESEWEAACRAGSTREWGAGEDGESPGVYAWYSENSGDRAHEVATRARNAWGLFDLHGNVWEWCEDAWHASYRLPGAATGPRWAGGPETTRTAPTDGSAWGGGTTPDRVYRGGCWNLPAERSRSARRRWNRPSLRWYLLGFRPAVTITSER